MSGPRKFSELTKNFTPADRHRVEAIKAEMRATLKSESDKKGKSLTRR